LRRHSKLLISYINPHAEVSKDTIARWIKTIMVKSGIDINVYSNCRKK
jgi:hypothetical protein